MENPNSAPQGSAAACEPSDAEVIRGALAVLAWLAVVLLSLIVIASGAGL